MNLFLLRILIRDSKTRNNNTRQAYIRHLKARRQLRRNRARAARFGKRFEAQAALGAAAATAAAGKGEAGAEGAVAGAAAAAAAASAASAAAAPAAASSAAVGVGAGKKKERRTAADEASAVAADEVAQLYALLMQSVQGLRSLYGVHSDGSDGEETEKGDGISGLDEDASMDIAKGLSAHELSFRAWRCYYIAETYARAAIAAGEGRNCSSGSSGSSSGSSGSKKQQKLDESPPLLWRKALALYEHAAGMAGTAREQMFDYQMCVEAEAEMEAEDGDGDGTGASGIGSAAATTLAFSGEEISTEIQSLASLSAHVRRATSVATAGAFLARREQASATTNAVVTGAGGAGAAVQPPWAPLARGGAALPVSALPLAQRLGRFEPLAAGSRTAAADWPPALETVHAKPFLFDLAYNCLSYPEPELQALVRKLDVDGSVLKKAKRRAQRKPKAGGAGQGGAAAGAGAGEEGEGEAKGWLGGWF